MTLVILSLFVWNMVTLCSPGWPRTCSEEPGWTQLYRDHLCLFPKHWDEKCASSWLAASSAHPAAGSQLQPQLDLSLQSSRFMSAGITGRHRAWSFDILSIPITGKSFSPTGASAEKHTWFLPAAMCASSAKQPSSLSVMERDSQRTNRELVLSFAPWLVSGAFESLWLSLPTIPVCVWPPHR